MCDTTHAQACPVRREERREGIGAAHARLLRGVHSQGHCGIMIFVYLYVAPYHREAAHHACAEDGMWLVV